MIHGLNQTLTYWPLGPGDRFGSGFLTPILIQGRYEEKNEPVLTATGETKISKSKILTDYAITEDGYIIEGDSTDVGDPNQVVGAQQLGRVGSSPDMRSAKRLYTGYILS